MLILCISSRCLPSAVVVWDREDYIKESEKRLGDSDVYEEVSEDPELLTSTIHKTMEKIWKRGDFKKETIEYFEVKDAKFARFYLLPKIYKRLNNVPGRPVISNCGYHTENISAFLDFYLKLLAQGVKLYIKDTNDFFNNLRSFPKLPGNIILWTVDVVGLYQNNSYEESLSVLRKRLDNRMEKYISSDTLCDLAETVLKNNFGKKTLKQKRETGIGTKFEPSYSILLWQNWKRKLLEKQNLPMVEVY